MLTSQKIGQISYILTVFVIFFPTLAFSNQKKWLRILIRTTLQLKRGHTSSYVKQFGFYDNFPRPAIFKENLMTGVTKNADISKILMSHELFWSENKVEELFYLLTTFHCHWIIFEGFRGLDT